MNKDNLVKFAVFKKPFEEALTVENLLAIEKTDDVVIRNDDFRVHTIRQSDLFLDGTEAEGQQKQLRLADLESLEYVGGKWGGKYLRAPDIFFDMLETAKDSLVRLGKICIVNEGKPTGANEFFYVPKSVTEQFGIEEEFLKPGLIRPRNANFIELRATMVDRYFFTVTRTREGLKGTAALRYIQYGEELGIHRRKTFASKKEWFRFDVRSPAQLLIPCGLGATFFCTINRAGAISSNSFAELRIDREDYRYPICAYFNSAIGRLVIEIYGRSSLGGGMLKVDPIDYRAMPVLSPSILTLLQRHQMGEALRRLSKRPVKTIFEEIGLHKPNRDYSNIDPADVSLGKVPPDQRALDAVVFEALGLPEEEQLEVYKAVVELVKNRLVKARSV